MPSFDVVSKTNLAEVDNAVNQARKEIATRYDFQGTHTEISFSDDKTTLHLKANSEGRLQAAYDVLQSKLVKRGVSLRALQPGPVEKAKELIKALKDTKMKVQGSIQGDQLRITGKNKDDLQAAMALFRGQQEKVNLDLQFTNFRDS